MQGPSPRSRQFLKVLEVITSSTVYPFCPPLNTINNKYQSQHKERKSYKKGAWETCVDGMSFMTIQPKQLHNTQVSEGPHACFIHFLTWPSQNS